jgi:hypothetical protein
MWREKSNMSSQTIVLGFLVILSIGVITSSPYVYADSRTITANFTIDPAWDEEWACDTFMDPLTGLKAYRCMFYEVNPIKGQEPQELVKIDPNETPFCAALGLVYDPTNKRCVTQQALEEEAKQEYLDTLPQDSLTPIQQEIRKLESDTNLNATEKEALELLKTLQGAQCFNDTLVSQTWRAFDVPTTMTVDPITGKQHESLVRDQNPRALDLSNNQTLLKLKLAVEECIGQPFTKKSIQYDHIVVEDDVQPYHSQVASAMAIPAAVLEDMENNQANRNTLDFCDSYNSERTKSDYGCPTMRVYQHDYLAPVPKDYGDSDPLKKLEMWKTNPDSVLDELKQHKLQQYKERQSRNG